MFPVGWYRRNLLALSRRRELVAGGAGTKDRAEHRRADAWGIGVVRLVEDEKDGNRITFRELILKCQRGTRRNSWRV